MDHLTGARQRKLTVAEAAEYLSCSESSLNKARIYGGGPRYIKGPGRQVRYDLIDLETWVESRKRTSTSQLAAA